MVLHSVGKATWQEVLTTAVNDPHPTAWVSVRSKACAGCVLDERLQITYLQT